MYRNAVKALGVIVLTEFILLGLGYFYPESGWKLSIWGNDTVEIKYKNLAYMLDYTPSVGVKGDTVLNNLIAQGADIQSELDSLPNEIEPPLGDKIFDIKPYKPRIPDSKFFKKDTSELGKKIKFTNPEQPNGYALDNFFESLNGLEKTDRKDTLPLVRIAHYGDSQIEGDRVSHYLRENLHHRFGGKGVGLIPLMDVANHHAIRRSNSVNWRKYTVFKDRYINNFYGMGGTVFRFQPAVKYISPNTADSSHFEIIINSKPTYYDKGTFWLAVNNWIHYDQISLHWGKASDPFIIKVLDGDTVLKMDTLPASDKYHKTCFEIPNNKKNLTFEFLASKCPDIYGVSLDGKGGIQVDNFGLRGHSGNDLARIDNKYLSHQVKELNTKLFIFQYGGNVVPYPGGDFKWLEDDLYRVLMKYKSAAPGASMLVIGVADMAAFVEGKVISYSTVVKIRDAQKRAAERAYVAFWDLYEIMGGRGSIISWVNSNPPLAAADFAHFSPAGQKLIGNLLYKALMNEYDHFLLRKELKINQQAKGN